MGESYFKKPIKGRKEVVEKISSLLHQRQEQCLSNGLLPHCMIKISRDYWDLYLAGIPEQFRDTDRFEGAPVEILENKRRSIEIVIV